MAASGSPPAASIPRPPFRHWRCTSPTTSRSAWRRYSIERPVSRQTARGPMTTLRRRKVGKTNLEVTELGLGGAPIGGFRATISDAEAIKLTDAAYDGGVRYFDTSPFYGYGRSELRMGAALREKPR